MTAFRAAALDGTPLILDAAAVDRLAAGLRGPLLRAGHAGYDEARSVWNAMIDRRPALIARCEGTADAVHAVRFAKAQGLRLAVKGGGHNISGLAVADGALVLDLSPMRGVVVDPAARVAYAQAGCLLGDLDRETQVHGLAAPLGFVSATGIAGLTLGGGFGYLTRRSGWTCDNVRTMTVVTADGRVVRAGEDGHRDLLWGLRGGGGNLGVVTDFAYELQPVGPEIVGGAIAWGAEAAGEVLDLYRRVVSEAPPELVVVAGLRLAPPAPWLPQEIHRQPIVALFVCHTGAVADAEREVARLKAFGRPVGDIVQRRPYVSQQSLLDGTQPRGRRNYWKSEYLPAVEPALLERMVAIAQRGFPSPHSALILFPIDGALNRLPGDHSSVGNRDARFVLNIGAQWERAEDDAVNVEWARAAWRALRGFSTGGTYVNFLTEEEDGDRVRAAYGRNYRRLMELKAAWDPDNLFRVNKNIAPGDAAQVREGPGALAADD